MSFLDVSTSLTEQVGRQWRLMMQVP